jgi:putative tryptophan/tyrosine transport system ATP-binding protein
VVRLEGITKVFHPCEVNEVIALRQVTLRLKEGEFLVVLGGNGSGKSTLLNLVAGAFYPDAGAIFVEEQDLTFVPEFERATMMGRVFQDPAMGTSAGLTIEENFALAASRGKRRGLGPALGSKLRAEIRDRLSTLGMGLENRMKAKVGLLSGGQRQALTLLMAVFRKPKVLLLDEHTAALDPRASREILSLTKSFVRDYGLTTLMVTHNLAHAREIGQRAIVMSRGQIASDLDAQRLSAMTVQDLMALFLETQKDEYASLEPTEEHRG